MVYKSREHNDIFVVLLDAMACRMPRQDKKNPPRVTHGCGHGDCAPKLANRSRASYLANWFEKKAQNCGWGVPYVMNCKSLVTKAAIGDVAESVSKGWAKLRAILKFIIIIIATMTLRWDGTSIARWWDNYIWLQPLFESVQVLAAKSWSSSKSDVCMESKSIAWSVVYSFMCTCVYALLQIGKRQASAGILRFLIDTHAIRWPHQTITDLGSICPDL